MRKSIFILATTVSAVALLGALCQPTPTNVNYSNTVVQNQNTSVPTTNTAPVNTNSYTNTYINPNSNPGTYSPGY